MLLAGTNLAPSVAASSEFPAAVTADEPEAKQTGSIAFDIPTQSLASALDAYSISAHREVLYNGELAVGRQSATVKGHFTPEAALQALLDGTGLFPRYMAADAFVLMEDDHALGPFNTAPSDVVIRYYGRIQASLKQAFCADRRTHPGDYRVAVGFRIGSSGIVSRVELLSSTGDSALDTTIGNAVRGLVIGAPPPPGFAQPIILVVTPQSQGTVRDCELAGVQSAKITP